MGIENRRHRRLRLTSVPAPARLFTADDRRELSFRPVDISKVGLGLLIAERLEVDSELVLALDGHEVLLQVKWRAPEPHYDDLCRYGLFAPSDEIDLEQMFFAYGCLEEDLDDDAAFESLEQDSSTSHP